MKQQSAVPIQPTSGTRWTHRNGGIYYVLILTNVASTRPEYPVTVVYQGSNGNLWSRALSDWHRSFTFLPDAPEPAQPAQFADFASSMRNPLVIRDPDATPECWCYECDAAGLTSFSGLLRMRMNLCPTCGNKRCPRSTNHNLACTGSNEPGQEGSIYGPAITV